jgi:hypothetical protein
MECEITTVRKSISYLRLDRLPSRVRLRIPLRHPERLCITGSKFRRFVKIFFGPKPAGDSKVNGRELLRKQDIFGNNLSLLNTDTPTERSNFSPYHTNS